jgi:hypothetical protein
LHLIASLAVLYLPIMTLLLTFLFHLASPVDTIHLEKNLVVSNTFNRHDADRNVISFNTVLKKSANTRTVFKLPRGKIWITSSLFIPDNTNLVGHEGGSEFILNDGAGDYTEGIIVNENVSLANDKMNSNIQLYNFTINGNHVERKDKSVRGIFFNKVSNLAIKKLIVLNTKQEGIRVDVNNLNAESRNIEISDCYVSRRDYKDANIILRSIMNDGSNSEGWPSKVSNAVIKNNISIGGVYGVCLSNVSNVKVANNTCTANFWRGIIISPTCSDIMVKKNRIDSAGSTGIHIAFYGRNITIDSNTVSNTLQDMSGKGYEGQGIKFYVGFDKITITNNYCYNNATDGIALEGGADGKNFLIEKNTVANNRRNGIRLLSGPFVIKKGGSIRQGRIINNVAIDNKSDAISFASEDKNHTIEGVTVKKNKLKATKGVKKINIQDGLGAVLF